jgi:hypothetical protein
VEKKLPELLSQINKKWPDERPIRLMFQDEARFGRISDIRYSWCPKPFRTVCRAMVTQEYTFAYAAVSVVDGVLDSLILPYVNTSSMQLLLDEVAARHATDGIVMIADGTGWYRSETLVIPKNMRLIKLPPMLLSLIQLSIYGTNYEKSLFIIVYLKPLAPLKITCRHYY